MSVLTQPYTAERDNPRWPMEPVCECGARPGADFPVCAQAAGEALDGADLHAVHVDTEDCPRWQAVATATGWYAPIAECEGQADG